MLLLYIYIIVNSFPSVFAHRNMLNDTLWRWDDVAETYIVLPYPCHRLNVF